MARVSSPVVLITGCSSGIGAEAARQFARAGYRVFASMRRPERSPELRKEAEAAGWTLSTPSLDVTSDSSVNMAVHDLLAETGGRIDVLVNNAGYYCVGPIEETTPAELGAQLETNVLGVLRVTRAVLPAMRAAGAGTVINVSSISGLVVVPLAGPYHASKFALEALTEGLRYELRPFGIRVVAVEPGLTATSFHHNEVWSAGARRADSPYAAMTDTYQRLNARLPRAQAPAVAAVIVRAARARRPRLRWRVGPTSFSGGVLRRLTPDWLYETLIRLVFHRRRPALAPAAAAAESGSGRGGSGPV
jgi:NAD(P)-dependent dehydrogenase (short-subunit alcohol dehydrogenase family)